MSQLINSTAEIKAQFATIDGNIEWSSFESFEQDVERDIIQAAIGPDALTYFTGNLTGLSAIPLQALQLLQRSAAYLTVLNWSQTSTFRITDKALYISKGSDGVVISDKKLRDFRSYCEETGLNYLDKAIDLMERNLVLFPAYAESGVRQENMQGFIRTALEFSQQRNIKNSRSTFLALRQVMLDAQDHYLPVAFGSYYELYKERFLDDELSAAEKSLLPMVKKAVAFLTLANAGDLPLQFSAEGAFIIRYNDSINYEQRDQADLARLQYALDDNREKGLRKLREIQSYLLTNASSFPGLVPPVAEDNSYNTAESGLYLM